MFWNKWIPRQYLVKSEVFVVEACYEESGLVYYYTYLKNKNNKLSVNSTNSSDKLEFPGEVTKNKTPLVLILNGKGVILKKVNLNDENADSFETLIRNNLPAINVDDFYIQLYRQENSSCFISLCRRDLLDNITSQFSKANQDLANVFIGAPSILGLQPLWSKFNSLLLTCQRIELTNGFLDVINSENTKEKEKIQIEDLTVSSDHALGLAGGLAYFTQRSLTENNNSVLDDFQVKHRETNQFRFLTMMVVAIAFVLAITNVFFYTSYFDKNNKLDTELAVYQGKYEQINQLLNDYQENKDLIEDAGVLSKNKLSEYADRIGKTLPDEVVLSELYFNPKEEKDESEDSLMTFSNKELILRGNCEKSFIVNEWLSVLKMQKFIKEVNLEKFIYNNNGVTPNFEIKLKTE